MENETMAFTFNKDLIASSLAKLGPVFLNAVTDGIKNGFTKDTLFNFVHEISPVVADILDHLTSHPTVAKLIVNQPVTEAETQDLTNIFTTLLTNWFTTLLGSIGPILMQWLTSLLSGLFTPPGTHVTPSSGS